MQFDYVDEVVRVTDAECFDMARRLVREEGIFTGGSSGGAVAGAIKYAERFPNKELNIVVIMCDSSARYLTKLFDDDWMRENGFLQENRDTARVSDLLGEKPSRNVHTAKLGDTIDDVVALMKAHSISQLPVTDGGRVVGIVNETTVLNHLLGRGEHGDKIDDLVETQFAIVEPSNKLGIVGQFFKQNKIVIVVDDNKIVGIVTKIDFIDYVSSKM